MKFFANLTKTAMTVLALIVAGILLILAILYTGPRFLNWMFIQFNF